MPKATEIRPASEVTRWDAEADVIVVGLGCAGASAAMEAHDLGAEVLVVERASGGGGTSANSGGLIYMGGGTPVQKAAGFDDTPEELFKFLMAVASPGPNEAKIRLFSEGSVDHFHWLESLGVPFKRSFYPEPSMESATDDCLVFSGGEDAAPWNELARPAPRAHKPQTVGKAGPFFMQCMLRAVEQRPFRREFDVKVEALFHQDGRAWLLLDDSTFMRNFFDQEPWVVGETIAAVESEAGFPTGTLQATVEFYNRSAAKGIDPIFQKRQKFLIPLENPPYALMDCCIDGEGTYSGFTVGGLSTGLSGEVLDSEGDEIPGLYAAGRTSALFCGQGYAASGISLADGTFFGRRAGRAAASSS